MGVTGAGKSYFIKEVSGSEEAIISDGLESFTPKIMTYRFPYAGSMITLVDTPGFNDTFRTDADVLEDIAEWLEFTYRVNFRLRGIIYLHRISNIRMEGTAVRSLVMLRKLCGDEALQNMVLTTTHWSNVNKSVGNRREEELLTNPQFWGGLVERGAKVARFDGDRGSGLALIDLFMSMKHKTVTLAIQDELVNKQKELRDTAAGIAIHDGLKRLVQQYEASLRELRKEWTEVARTQNGELDRILAEEQRKLRSEMSGLEVKRQQLMVGREERVKIREQQWQEKSKQMSAVYRERQRKLGSGQLLDTALYRNQLHLLPQRPVLLVYAKATTEVGNVGVTGEWFSQKLKRALPRQVAVQGADYNALTSPLSLLKSGSDSAARAMVDAVDVAIKSSPTTKVVLSGMYTYVKPLAQFIISDFGCF